EHRERVLAVEIVARMRQHVVDAGTDDAQRHRPQGDVEHHTGFCTTPGETHIRHPHGDDDADEDADRVGVDVELQAEHLEAEDPPRLIRAGDAHGCDHGSTSRFRTVRSYLPAASARAVSARPARPPSARAFTRALPTITPSAYSSTCRTCSPVEMP